MKAAISFMPEHQYPTAGAVIVKAAVARVDHLQTQLFAILDELKALPKDMEDCALLLMMVHDDHPKDHRAIKAKLLSKEANRIQCQIDKIKQSTKQIENGTMYLLSSNDLEFYGL